MWHDLNITKVSCIEKTVAEFTVTMIPILPYAKMKIKIYEDQSGFYRYDGFSNKRKFDGCPSAPLDVEVPLKSVRRYYPLF
ncbi:hypothetical protein J4731_13280 [Providencia rettgeri]|nr:hypothetical protein [Providencia rettgeri]